MYLDKLIQCLVNQHWDLLGTPVNFISTSL